MYKLLTNLFSPSEKYDMSAYKSDECEHRNVYVQEIYYIENIPLDDNVRSSLSVPVENEYLTLKCNDCPKTWNGKRTTFKPVVIKVGDSEQGATGWIPKYFTEIKQSECSHPKFNTDATVTYIEPWDYTNNNNNTELWAFCQANCLYCKGKFQVKRNYLKETENQITVNKLVLNTEWTRCKIMLE